MLRNGTRSGQKRSRLMAVASGFVSRRLSPPALRYARFYWWNCRFYLPRLIASIFVRRTPQIHDFSQVAPRKPFCTSFAMSIYLLQRRCVVL